MSEEKIVFRFDELTAGELELIEEMAGPGGLEGVLAGRASAKLRNILEWIVRRRSEPDLSLDDVRAQPVKDLRPIEIVGSTEDPTGAAGS